MVCNSSFIAPILGGTNTVVQMYYQLSAGGLNEATGLPMSLPLRIPDTIDVSVLADGNALKCFAEVLQGSGSPGLAKNAVEIEGELYAFLTGNDPEKATTSDVLSAFQGAHGKVITKQQLIAAYCGEDAKDACDAASLGAQPLVAYIKSLETLVDGEYQTPNQKKTKAVNAALEASNKAQETRLEETVRSQKDAETRSEIFMGTTIGLAGAVVLIGTAAALLRRRSAKPQTKSPETPPPPKQPKRVEEDPDLEQAIQVIVSNQPPS